MALMLTARLFDIIHQKYDYQKRQREISQKIFDLQKYASNIGDGSISMQDMMRTPASLFQRSMMYMNYAHNGAMMGANQNMQQMMMLPMVQNQMAQMQDPNQQAMYQQWMFKNLYEQERQKFAKQEEKLLHEQEKELQKEKTDIEIQIKMLEEEYNATKQAVSDSAKYWKPEYVA